MEAKIEELESLSKSDYDGQIRHLSDRKAYWKKLAIELNRRLDESKKNTKVLREMLEKEKKMTNIWRTAFCVVGTITIALITAVLVSSQVVSIKDRVESHGRLPASGIAPETPTHAMASVLLYNGDIQGSGTIIAKGDKYATLLSAAHNFSGIIGGHFWVYYPDGTYTQATLIAIDTNRDLAIARVDAHTVTGKVWVPSSMPTTTDSLVSVGYPRGIGPNLRYVKYVCNYEKLWRFDLQTGEPAPGDSGCGLFLGDALIGVVSQEHSANKSHYAVSLNDINAFLNENRTKLAGCGDWSTRPVVQVAKKSAPPLWKPIANVPLPISTEVTKEISNLKQELADLKKQREREAAITAPSVPGIPEPIPASTDLPIFRKRH